MLHGPLRTGDARFAWMSSLPMRPGRTSRTRTATLRRIRLRLERTAIALFTGSTGPSADALLIALASARARILPGMAVGWRDDTPRAPDLDL